ncbi:MAG TPA: tetratricopeptide repeat protein [Candidatus Uhrbacteria bacterium]|nr:tetratricopeptide repeat protein [Candidatus Uhrbacteria bacterium]
MNFIFVSFRSIALEFKNTSEFFLAKLIRALIYLSVFLIPFFFVPFQPVLFEFGKVVLFYLLVILALIAWLIKIYLSKKIIFQFKFLDLPFILLLLAYFLASFFSIDKHYSYWGGDFIILASFLTFLFLILFYFLTSRFIETLHEFKCVIASLVWSILFVLVLNILNFSGISQFFNAFFFPAATLNFLLVLGVLASFYLFLTTASKKIRILNLVLFFLFLVFLYVIDNPHSLFLLAFSIFIFILLLSFQASYFSNKLVVALTFLLFFTVVVLILPVSNYTNLIFPSELKLSNNFGWQITKSTLSDNFLFGVGPQNFAYSFYKYKPLEFNQTVFCQLGFEKNSNFWLEILNNLGVLGFFLVLVIFIKYLHKAVVFLKNFKIFTPGENKKFISFCFANTVLFSFFAFGLFYNFDFILIFLFFLFIALGVNLTDIKYKEPAFTYQNKQGINLLFYVALILIISFLYFASRSAVDEINLERQRIKDFNSIEDFDKTEALFYQAIKNNPSRKDYHLRLADLLLAKEIFMASSAMEFDRQKIEQQIVDNLSRGFAGERINNYFILRQILEYMEKLGFTVRGWQEENLEKLIELDPNNPDLYIDRALLNFGKYLLIKEGQFEINDKEREILLLSQKIKSDLEKSIELKDDFILGYYNLGLYFEEFGDSEKALEKIEKAYSLDPSQKIIVLSLKKLYLNQDKVKQAQQVLAKYLEFQPEDEEVKAMLEELK